MMSPLTFGGVNGEETSGFQECTKKHRSEAGSFRRARRCDARSGDAKSERCCEEKKSPPEKSEGVARWQEKEEEIALL
jgi:hypothetical protein